MADWNRLVFAARPDTNEYYFRLKVMQDWWRRWYPSASARSGIPRQRRTPPRDNRDAAMSLVPHKYTPRRCRSRSWTRLRGSRPHGSLPPRGAARSDAFGTLSSFVITGPGSGQVHSDPHGSTAHATGRGAESRLVAVVFPEEQFSVLSLRDFLAAILRELAAGDWRR